MVGFALAILPIWLWRQGYISAHGSNFFNEGGDPTDVRFHDQAVADRFTADGKQIHADLEKMNTLLRAAPKDLKLRIQQQGATVAAINQDEQSVDQARADIQTALDNKQYATQRDRRKLEDLLKIFEIRKKVADVHLHLDDMNSDIRYLNIQAADMLKRMGEEMKPEASPPPPVFEVGAFSEGYGVENAGPPDKMGMKPLYTKENPLVMSHGFVLTSDGIAVIKLSSLLTEPRLQVRFADGRLYTVNTILSYNLERDIAIVRLGRPFSEQANFPDELPSFSLEVEGVPRPAGGIAIQTLKERLKADSAGAANPNADTFAMSFTQPANPLVMRSCGLPVVNSENQVIGVLCAKTSYYPKLTELPQIPSPAEVVSSNVLRTLLAQDQGLRPNAFFYSMKRTTRRRFRA